MKVAIVTAISSPHGGVYVNLFSSLHTYPQGIEPFIICPSSPSLPKDDKRILQVPMEGTMFENRIPFIREFNSKCLSVLNKLNPDVLISCVISGGHCLGVYENEKCLKVYRNDISYAAFSEELELYGVNHDQQYKEFIHQHKQLEIQAMECADIVMVYTPEDAERIHSYYGIPKRKMIVFQFTGVDPNVYHPLPSKEHVNANELLFVGRTGPIKGFGFLLEAMSIVKSKGINVSLKVVGQNPFDCYSQKITDLGLCSSIKHIETVSAHEVIPYYQRAKLIIIPSIRESFCRVAMEAMACGLPVLGSNTGGIAYQLRDFDAQLFPVGESRALARKIIHALTNQHSWSRWRKRQLHRVTKELNLTNQIEKEIKIYQRQLNLRKD